MYSVQFKDANNIEDFKGLAITLLPRYVTDIPDWEGLSSLTHSDGWTISGVVHEDYFYWVNEFEASHPDFGRVWGDFEHTVFADSKEAYDAFSKAYPVHIWDYWDI